MVGLADAAVEYYDGSGWIQLQGTGWDNAVNSMVANWSVAGLPQLVVSLGNGLIQFYNSKVRYTTYMQMTEAMLAPLRQGRSSIAAWPSGCHEHLARGVLEPGGGDARRLAARVRPRPLSVCPLFVRGGVRCGGL